MVKISIVSSVWRKMELPLRLGSRQNHCINLSLQIEELRRNYMKKKRRKNLTSILCLMLLVVFASQPVMAADGQARAIICPACGNGTIITEKSYSSWYVSKEAKCEHYVYGYDIVWERKVYTVMKCGMCQQEYDSSTTTQTKTECQGSATP